MGKSVLTASDSEQAFPDSSPKSRFDERLGLDRKLLTMDAGRAWSAYTRRNSYDSNSDILDHLAGVERPQTRMRTFTL